MPETLTIKFEDGAGSKPVSPSPPTASGAGSPTSLTSLPDSLSGKGNVSTSQPGTTPKGPATFHQLLTDHLRVTRDIYLELQSQGTAGRTGGAGGAIPKTGGPTPTTAGILEQFGGLTKALGTGFGGIIAALRIAAIDISLSGRQYAAEIRHNTEEAKTAELERRKNITGNAAGVTGFAVGTALSGGNPIIGAVVGLIAKGLSDAVSDIGLSAQKKFQEMKDAFRDQTNSLARYNQPLAQQMAVGQVAQQRRDIAEAQILANSLGQLEQRQQQLDRLNQQIEILGSIDKAADQLAKVNGRIEEKQKELAGLMASTDENTRKMVKELEKQAKTPLEVLEERGGFAKPNEGIRLARERNLLDRMRDAGLNVPLLGEGR